LGLSFICKPNKAEPFIGRDAYLARRAAGRGPFLYSVKLSDPHALLHHNEPVLKHGEVVGFVTSGAYSAGQGAAIGLCLLSPTEGADIQSLEGDDAAVLVEGRAVPAIVRRSPFGGCPLQPSMCPLDTPP